MIDRQFFILSRLIYTHSIDTKTKTSSFGGSYFGKSLNKNKISK